MRGPPFQPDSRETSSRERLLLVSPHGWPMREARRTQDGRWYVVEGQGSVCRISPPSWEMDKDGFWPKVELLVRSLGETVSCPACGSTWIFEEMDCVFGTAKREGNDVVALVRCTTCRLPHRTRAVGFITAYPRVVQLMEGWAGWERRQECFAQEELKLYGAEAVAGPE